MAHDIQNASNAAIPRRIRGRERAAALRDVDLDQIVRAEIAHYPAAEIGYAGTTARVLADDLLSEVFTNLIGNSIRHGGPEAAITIGVDERAG